MGERDSVTKKKTADLSITKLWERLGGCVSFRLAICNARLGWRLTCSPIWSGGSGSGYGCSGGWAVLMA